MEERRGLMMVRRRRGEGSGAERGEECLEVEALSLSKQRRLFQRGGGGGGGGDERCGAGGRAGARVTRLSQPTPALRNPYAARGSVGAVVAAELGRPGRPGRPWVGPVGPALTSAAARHTVRMPARGLAAPRMPLRAVARGALSTHIRPANCAHTLGPVHTEIIQAGPTSPALHSSRTAVYLARSAYTVSVQLDTIRVQLYSSRV